VTCSLPEVETTFIIALCEWKEGSDQPAEARNGIGWVVYNRVKMQTWWGRTPLNVVVQPWQFSSFTAPSDPNLTRWPRSGDVAWQECLASAKGIYDGAIPDPTDGAVYYYSKPLTSPPHGWGPVTETKTIGEIHFCKPQGS
jgi:cell wall hydrolase